MAAPSESLAAELQDRYRLLREVGRGGMATVYLAHDVRHDRDVALKVLRPELAAVLGRERFLAEIRTTARLDHPHILTLIDSGQSGDLLWYVVPFIRGESLRQKLARETQLGVDEALAIARQVAGALDYAHRQGIIHRDVKPENILLHEGEAMLADFGIALAVREAGGERLTSTGLSLGTPHYMSPEQATAERALDARSDVYSLGAVLYELLAGEPPFHGTTAQAVVARMLTERPTRLRLLRDTVPESVEAAVERALARVPADRFASAAEFATALATAARPARRKFRPTRGSAAAMAGIAVLATAGISLFRGHMDSATAPVTLRPFTVSGTGLEPAISPDGRRLAYTNGPRSLVVQPIDGGEPVVLVPTSRFVQQPRWTGDGSAILFEMYRDSLTPAATWMVPSGGGTARQVMDDQDAFDAGPDSTLAIRYQRPTSSLEIVELATGRVRSRFPLPDSVEVEFVDGVAWSPDQGLVALAAGGVWVLRLADSALVRVAQAGTAPRWGPSGRSLFFLGGPPGALDLWRIGMDAGTGRARGKPIRVLGVPRARRFDVGAGGRLVVEEVTSSSRAQVMSVPRRPGPMEDERVLGTGSADVRQTVISDDGEWVAVARDVSGNKTVAGTSGRVVIDLVPLAGGAARPLGPASASQLAPEWAPDGRRLTLLRADSSGHFVTLVSLADGSARRLGSRPAVAGIFALGGPTWSADGSRVVYLAAPNQLVIVDPERLTETTIVIPDSIGTAAEGQVLSPHGDSVIVSTLRRPTDWEEEWLGDVATGRWTRMVEPWGNSRPLRWLADGTIYVLNDRALAGESGHLLREIWAIRADRGRPRFVASLPDGCMYASISADGRRVACDLHQDVSDLLMASDFAAGES